MDWVLKYYLDELQLQRVKYPESKKERTFRKTVTEYKKK
jgi:hypothetical protein